MVLLILTIIILNNPITVIWCVIQEKMVKSGVQYVLNSKLIYNEDVKSHPQGWLFFIAKNKLVVIYQPQFQCLQRGFRTRGNIELAVNGLEM